MRPVAPEVYRAALDKLEIAKRALRRIATIGGDQGTIAVTALDTIRSAEAWDKCRCPIGKTHRLDCTVNALLEK
jgi:hypothetical protein